MINNQKSVLFGLGGIGINMADILLDNSYRQMYIYLQKYKRYSTK